MNRDHRNTTEDAVVAEEAQAWLRRLESGEATQADASALDLWRARSPRHAAAFADAVLLWNVLGDAARMSSAQIAAGSGKSAMVTHRSKIARRALIVGGGAMAASAAAILLARPPMDLWPSVSELAADYRTATGETQRIDLAGQISVQMNTRTSVDLRAASTDAARIELLAGEAGIRTADQTSRPIVVVAGSGDVRASKAAFNILKNDSNVSVTCIDGEVDVRCPAGAHTIKSGQQVIYNDRRISGVASVDADIVTAWQRGLLIFRDVPLAQVIDEVNRYRSGRIILTNSALKTRQVVATFRTDRIDDVILFVSKVMHVPARSLPGGIVLLG